MPYAPVDRRQQPGADSGPLRVDLGDPVPQREERRLCRRLRRGFVAQQPQRSAEDLAGMASVKQGGGGGIPRRQAPEQRRLRLIRRGRGRRCAADAGGCLDVQASTVAMGDPYVSHLHLHE